MRLTQQHRCIAFPQTLWTIIAWAWGDDSAVREDTALAENLDSFLVARIRGFYYSSSGDPIPSSDHETLAFTVHISEQRHTYVTNLKIKCSLKAYFLEWRLRSLHVLMQSLICANIKTTTRLLHGLHTLEQRFSAFLMLEYIPNALNTVPRVGRPATTKLFSLLLHKFTFAAVMNQNVNIW